MGGLRDVGGFTARGTASAARPWWSHKFALGAVHVFLVNKTLIVSARVAGVPSPRSFIASASSSSSTSLPRLPWRRAAWLPYKRGAAGAFGVQRGVEGLGLALVLGRHGGQGFESGDHRRPVALP